ncbi:MAG: hypothetical protein HY925_06550 [Elusimicrobia bacterium]|nr:hypothetical protein [Elusimicrobiota bacterium]
MQGPMTLLAIVFLLGAAPARAAVTLRPPVELETKITTVKDVLADPEADAGRVHEQAQAMFDQAQNTHHIPVDGLGYNPTRQDAAAPGQKATIKSILDTYHTLTAAEPPSPLMVDEEFERDIVKGELRMQEINAKGDMGVDGENGKAKVLPDEALAAYQWQVGASEAGSVVFQNFFPELADWTGEFATETFAHEADHAVRGKEQDLEHADHVEREVTAMRKSWYFITHKITDYSWKFAHMAQQVMNNPKAPAYVKQTLVHIGKILDNCGTPDGCKKYASALYGDGEHHH